MKDFHLLAPALLFIALSLYGCGDSSTKPDSLEKQVDMASPKPESTMDKADAESPAEAPAEAETGIDVPALVAKIEAADDLVAWFKIRESYLATDKTVPEIEEALAAREKALLNDNQVKSVNDALEIVQFKWDLEGEPTLTGERETFRGTWLFRVNEPVILPEGHELRLVLRCSFDASHQQYFEEDKREIDLTFVLKPAITQWKAGDYKLLSHNTYRKLPNIPYRIQTILSEVRKGEDGNWTYVGRFGTAVSHGWHAYIGENNPPKSTIDADASGAGNNATSVDANATNDESAE